MTVFAKNEDMLSVMEEDLKSKIGATLTSSSVSGSVHGVFSLDDLEKKRVDELCGGIGIGVAYHGCSGLTSHPAQNNPAGPGDSAKGGDFFFMVLVAAPVDELCTQRVTATKILTLLRLGIQGQGLALGREQRNWTFVQEKPEVAESSETVLYYTQLWRLVLPIVSK